MQKKPRTLTWDQDVCGFFVLYPSCVWHRGGPAYYLEKALNARWMGITFAMLISLTFGLAFNSVQANTIMSAFNESFGIKKVSYGNHLGYGHGCRHFWRDQNGCKSL